MENSTEKLLDVIRTSKESHSRITSSPDSKKISRLVQSKIIKKKSLNLGIFIGDHDIVFVLTAEKGRNKRKFLIKWAIVEIPADIGADDAEFPIFLRTNLSKFTEGITGIALWCNIDSEYVKLRTITIPDVAESKIANAAFWKLKKELDFEAEEEIFDFYFLGDIDSGKQKSKKILSFIAQKSQIDKLETIFLKAGYSLKGIAALPFALQNFIHTRHLNAQDEPFAIVNLSKEHSEMFCYADYDLLLARKIRTDLYDLLEEAEKSLDMEETNFFPTTDDFQNNQFFQIKQSSERLIDKMVRTAEYCSQNFAGNAPIKKFIFFGETIDKSAFSDLLSKRTSIRIERFKPVFDTLPGAIDVELPKNGFKRNQIFLAFGMALSANEYTPNFIHTYNDKIKKEKKKKINIAAVIGFILLAFICTGVSKWQTGIKKHEVDRYEALNQVKNTINPDANRNKILQLVAHAKEAMTLKHQYISAYFPLAVINEVCLLTPKQIHITSFDLGFGDWKNKKGKGTTLSKGGIGNVILSGTIVSFENSPGSELTQYILKLGESPLFERIEVLQRNQYEDSDRYGMDFKLTMNIL